MTIKICGLTRPDEVEHAARAGADLVGFVLAESSRRVSWEELPTLVQAIPAETGARPVAVLVNPAAADIERAFASGVQFVQLHGQESPEFCRPWQDRVIKAVAIRCAEDLERARAYAGCAALLLDSARPGSGQSWDWSCLENFDLPFILAGGLSSDSLAGACQLLAPYGVDASSALESAPGRKDPERVSHFIQTARRCG